MEKKDPTEIAGKYLPSLIVGKAVTSFSDATDHAIMQAWMAHPELDWYEVTKLEGTFKAGSILEWEVTIAVGPEQTGAEKTGSEKK